MSSPSCPLCGLNATVVSSGNFGSRVSCRRCGRFDVELDGLAGINQEQRYMLSAVSRDWTESGRTDVLTITQANVETLIERAPRPSVAERLNKILELTAQRTVGIGSLSTLTIELDYPLVAVRNPDEMLSLVTALEKRGLVWTERAALTNSIGLTVPGWERLEEIRRSGPSSSLVFVAMYFHTSTQALYDHGIKSAIRKAGYEPLRIDQHEHVNRIDDEIIGQVRRSRYMVADFTGQRGTEFISKPDS